VYRLISEGKGKKASGKGAEAARLQVVLEENPKWRLLSQLLTEVREECEKAEEGEGGKGQPSGARVLVLFRDDRTCAQLREYLQVGGRAMLERRFTHYLAQLAPTRPAAAASAAADAPPGAPKGRGKERKGGGGTGKEMIAQAERRLLAEEYERLLGGPPGTTGIASLLSAPRPPTLPSQRGRRGQGRGGRPKPQQGKKDAAPRKAGAKRKRPEFEEEEVGDGLARVEELFERTEMKEEEDGHDHGVHASEASLAGGVEVLGPLHVMCYVYSQAFQNMSLLEEVMPSHIILYDADFQFVREIEVHQVQRADKVKVYFMMYEHSVEEHRYLSSISQEKEAFERLIQEKKVMVMPANLYEAPRPALPLVHDTRTNKSKRMETVRVVVDVREFRSSLPSLLHQAGLMIIPVTLEVGDFVLTPEICVERKSITDLFGSFASGRLYTQVRLRLAGGGAALPQLGNLRVMRPHHVCLLGRTVQPQPQ
jgi:DNA excision repair protein ERCC-4